jgi:hypothetical protein
MPIRNPPKHRQLAQDMQYGTDEWQHLYASDRNTIEGTNAVLKRRRPRRRPTASARLHRPPQQKQKRRERKLLTRLRRKTRKDRIVQWDDDKPPIPAKTD